MTAEHTQFISGVIEGFYGRPWSPAQHRRLIDTLSAEHLSTFVYAPKFDPYHRLNWQQPYPSAALNHLNRLCKMGRQKNVTVVLSLSPGLTVKKSGYKQVLKRFEELKNAGAAGLALLMDDIPIDHADPDLHSDLLLMLMNGISGNITWFFCPTAYSGYHLSTWKNAGSYLEQIGRRIPLECRIFWTGNTVVPRSITTADLIRVQQMIKRKPLIWDNFPANDYVPANAFFPGPLTGRSADLHASCAGLLINPSEIFSASLAVTHTLAEWTSNPHEYDPGKAFDRALLKLTADPDSVQVLQDVFGYFYTPFDISAFWRELLERVERHYRNPSAEPSPERELETIRKRLHDERNRIRLPGIWLDIYPFVRTLLGDLDYLIALCRRIGSGGTSDACLVPRDPRWSTPVSDLISVLRNRL
jgi:hypothetical protein